MSRAGQIRQGPSLFSEVALCTQTVTLPEPTVCMAAHEVSAVGLQQSAWALFPERMQSGLFFSVDEARTSEGRQQM